MISRKDSNLIFNCDSCNVKVVTVAEAQYAGVQWQPGCEVRCPKCAKRKRIGRFRTKNIFVGKIRTGFVKIQPNVKDENNYCLALPDELNDIGNMCQTIARSYQD